VTCSTFHSPDWRIWPGMAWCPSQPGLAWGEVTVPAAAAVALAGLTTVSTPALPQAKDFKHHHDREMIRRTVPAAEAGQPQRGPEYPRATSRPTADGG
jgi:hypothetical protein